MSDVLEEKLDVYFRKAEILFSGVESCVPREPKLKKISSDFREMAFGYFEDAKHFRGKGELVNALAALEYAEGWLDAGKRLGVFKERRS